MFPVNSLITAGVPVAGSSDAPVMHYAPLFGIEQALTRRTMAGDVCGPDERVDLPTAICMYTIHGALASFEESFKGSLEVSKVADLVVLAEDLSRVPVEQLRHVGVAMTVVGGEVVYEASPSSGGVPSARHWIGDPKEHAMNREQAFVFDLDGTLVDSVYQHVLAWQEALDHAGIEVSVWRIHRRIGMSGGLLAHALLRETGRPMSPEDASRLRQLHADAYRQRMSQVRVLPGARELLTCLSELEVPWAIATSGYRESAGPVLELLGVAPEVPVITRDATDRAKPDPDLFLAAAARLDVDITNAMVIGDSVWDMLAARRARALGVGLLSGGYGQEELERAGAYRVYEDPADLLRHLDEVGIRRPSR